MRPSIAQTLACSALGKHPVYPRSYSPSASWNFSALIPYIDRGHTTYGNATTNQLTPDNLSGATSKGLGDIVGRYFPSRPESAL